MSKTKGGNFIAYFGGLFYNIFRISPNKMPPPTSFENIVRQFSNRVYNHAFRVLGNREQAEEATQDVFLKIYRSLESFRGESTLSTWIWRITANVCITQAKKSRLETSPLDSDEIDSISDDEPNPEQALLNNETKDEIANAISRLPYREATAINLFYLEEMDYGEIANILEIPAGSVATALHRGRERLRKLLQTSYSRSSI
ncbi:MAG: sigma-70 family RNA polymerase sigma factor [Ignavibacteriae bacterium]|nr:MAG: sigma-70 family RNA polymerase sigma factor [Ignavibacteriota bacterium]